MKRLVQSKKDFSFVASELLLTGTCSSMLAQWQDSQLHVLSAR